jgi:hypothetical protein
MAVRYKTTPAGRSEMDGKRYWQARDIAAIGGVPAAAVTTTDVRAALRSGEAEPTTDLVIDSLDEFAPGRVLGGCSCCQNYVFEPVRQWA